MRHVLPAILVVVTIAATVPASASQPPDLQWTRETYRSVTRTAALRGSGGQLTISCTISMVTPYREDTEIVIDLAMWQGSLPEAQEVRLTAGETTLAVLVREQYRPGSGVPGFSRHRYRPWTPEQVARVRLAFQNADREIVASAGDVREVFTAGHVSSLEAVKPLQDCSAGGVFGRQQARMHTNPAVLQALLSRAHATCRDGAGADVATWHACDEAGAYHDKLVQLGWCAGPVAIAGEDAPWRRCQRRR